MKVFYIIPLNYRLTGNRENFKIKLYYFEKRLSLQYNTDLKSQDNYLPKGPVF